MLAYFILTCLQFVLDLSGFFLGCAIMYGDYNEYSYASALITSMGSVFVSLDVYYIIWVFSNLIKFDAPEASLIVKALIGVPTGLRALYGDPNK